MEVVRLKYRKGLGYPGPGMLPKIPTHELARFDGGTSLFTFRKSDSGLPMRVVPKVSATTRIEVPASGQSIVLYGLESDSPIAPVLLWDIAHSAGVGATLYVYEDVPGDRYFDRDYFRGALERVPMEGSLVAYRKVAQLDAEHGSLDSWTFGIPAGPEDATLLNACVARILELDIPNKEILLCGRPAANFRYWDKVRIVGEDITAPPVQICTKKNRLAQEATYDNLCIIHDRVFLPSNFREMVQRFGNAFPLTAVQSLYFDDRHNFACRRYSDFGVGLRLASHVTQGLARGGELETSRFAPAVLTKIESTGFIAGNAHRYTENHYPTGSLYLVKKRVWARVPQDERLVWTEFEDIEQGERAAKLGIPSRVNPYGVTQSMISRPILAWLGSSLCEKPSGSEQTHRSIFEAVSSIPRKPLVKKTVAHAITDYTRFLNNWGVKPDARMEPVTSATQSTKRRLRWILQAVSAAQVPLQKDEVARFLKDFEKLVMCEQIPYDWHQSTLEAFARGGHTGMRHFLDSCMEIFNHAAQRPKGRIFAKALTDYLPTSALTVFVGSVVSALFLMGRNHKMVVLPPGFIWKLRAVLGSTPFARYACGTTPIRGNLLVRNESAAPLDSLAVEVVA